MLTQDDKELWFSSFKNFIMVLAIWWSPRGMGLGVECDTELRLAKMEKLYWIGKKRADIAAIPVLVWHQQRRPHPASKGVTGH